jgi:pimeloyl-ACP methyl ester carboxylesterase
MEGKKLIVFLISILCLAFSVLTIYETYYPNRRALKTSNLGRKAKKEKIAPESDNFKIYEFIYGKKDKNKTISYRDSKIEIAKSDKTRKLIFFLHGHLGDNDQIRPYFSKMRDEFRNQNKTTVDFFSFCFAEYPSASAKGIIEEEAIYAVEAISYILKTYYHPNVTFTIIGHSFGGISALFALKNKQFPLNRLRNLITINSPTYYHPFPSSLKLSEEYRILHENVNPNDTTFDHILYIQLVGGMLDFTVDNSLTRINKINMFKHSNYYYTPSYTNVFSDLSHNDILMNFGMVKAFANLLKELLKYDEDIATRSNLAKTFSSNNLVSTFTVQNDLKISENRMSESDLKRTIFHKTSTFRQEITSDFILLPSSYLYDRKIDKWIYFLPLTSSHLSEDLIFTLTIPYKDIKIMLEYEDSTFYEIPPDSYFQITRPIFFIMLHLPKEDLKKVKTVYFYIEKTHDVKMVFKNHKHFYPKNESINISEQKEAYKISNQLNKTNKADILNLTDSKLYYSLSYSNYTEPSLTHITTQQIYNGK